MLFPWQRECLRLAGVEQQARGPGSRSHPFHNLVYSAPTSGGKTLGTLLPFHLFPSISFPSPVLSIEFLWSSSFIAPRCCLASGRDPDDPQSAASGGQVLVRRAVCKLSGREGPGSLGHAVSSISCWCTLWIQGWRNGFPRRRCCSHDGEGVLCIETETLVFLHCGDKHLVAACTCVHLGDRWVRCRICVFACICGKYAHMRELHAFMSVCHCLCLCFFLCLCVNHLSLSLSLSLSQSCLSVSVSITSHCLNTCVYVSSLCQANSIVQKLQEENRLHELSMLIVDEVHMIGDPVRGHHLEILLTKLLFLLPHSLQVGCPFFPLHTPPCRLGAL